MIAASIAAMLETRLAPFRARWVLAYRAAWASLMLGALALLTQELLQPASTPAAILILRLIKAAVLIAVSSILLRRRGKDPVAALLSLAFLTWTITSSFDFASSDPLPQLLDRLRFLLFVLALLLFPDGRWQPSWGRSVAAGSVTVFLLGIAESLQLSPTRVFLPLAILCVLAAVGSLIMRFRVSTDYALKQQLKWVALGLVAGVGLILSARAGSALSSLQKGMSPILWEGMYQLGVMIVALGFLVSLLRFRLFDAETAISRSAAYATLTIALVATFGGTEALIQNLGQDYLGMNLGGISGGMAAAVAAVLLNPFHDRISDWAEQRFQHDLVLLKRQLPEMLEELAATATPSEIGAAILPRINEAVHATRSALIGPGPTVIAVHGISRRAVSSMLSELPCGRLPAFPVCLAITSRHSTDVGWLVLGPRPDGSLYGKEDLHALNFIRQDIRRALVRAAGREDSRRALRRQLRAMRKDMADLRGSVAAMNARISPTETGRFRADPSERHPL